MKINKGKVFNDLYCRRRAGMDAIRHRNVNPMVIDISNARATRTYVSCNSWLHQQVAPNVNSDN
jgi:hypothetical protein